jgi:hypothetical protein
VSCDWPRPGEYQDFRCQLLGPKPEPVRRQEGELISLPHRQTLAGWLGLWLQGQLTPHEGTGPGIFRGSRG